MGRDTKQPIKQGFYLQPTPEGYTGWVEDKAKTWILYYMADGSSLFFPERAPNGAIQPGMALGVPSVKRGPAAGVKRTQVAGSPSAEDVPSEYRTLWSSVMEKLSRDVCESKAYYDAALPHPKDIVHWTEVPTASGELEITQQFLEEQGINLTKLQAWLDKQAEWRHMRFSTKTNHRTNTHRLIWEFTPQTELSELIRYWEEGNGPFKLPDLSFKVLADNRTYEARQDSMERVWVHCRRIIAERVARAWEYVQAKRAAPEHMRLGNLGPVVVKLSHNELEAIDGGGCYSPQELHHYLTKEATRWSLIFNWDRQLHGSSYQMEWIFVYGSIATPLKELKKYWEKPITLPNPDEECTDCGEYTEGVSKLCSLCYDRRFNDRRRELPNGEIHVVGPLPAQPRSVIEDGKELTKRHIEISNQKTFQPFLNHLIEEAYRLLEHNSNQPENPLDVTRVKTFTYLESDLDEYQRQHLKSENYTEFLKGLEESLGVRVILNISLLAKGYLEYKYMSKEGLEKFLQYSRPTHPQKTPSESTLEVMGVVNHHYLPPGADTTDFAQTRTRIKSMMSRMDSEYGPLAVSAPKLTLEQITEYTTKPGQRIAKDFYGALESRLKELQEEGKISAEDAEVLSAMLETRVLI